MSDAPAVKLVYPDLFSRLLANSAESERYSFNGMPCWEWNGYRLRRGGYGRICRRVPGKGPQGFAVHRVCAELVLGRPLDPDLETLEHACEITWCWHPLHLGIATRADNTADMRARRTGKPRKVFKPLVDPALYVFDPLTMALPVLRASLDNASIPF